MLKLIGLCFFMGSSLIAADQLPKSSYVYSVIYSKGSYSIFHGAKKVNTKKMVEGDKIEVGEKSLVIVKSEKETLKISENTILVADELKKDSSVLNLIKGRLVSSVNNKKFSVKTKTASMGVRGTKFFTSFDGDNMLWMCVKEGEVVAHSQRGNDQIVKAGEGIFVTNSKVSPPKFFEWTKDIDWSEDAKDDFVIDANKLKASYRDLEESEGQ